MSEHEILKKDKMLKNKDDIDSWLKTMRITDYDIDDQFVVNCRKSVNLRAKLLKYLPVQFGVIEGFFDCSINELTSLKGSPHTLKSNQKDHFKGSFLCYDNKLTTLDYAPFDITGDFDCRNNQLKSLKNSPKKVPGNFNAAGNPIKNLMDGPKTVGIHYYVGECELKSLKGSPRIIHGDFSCVKNNLSSFNDGPKKVKGRMFLGENPNAKMFPTILVEQNIFFNQEDALFKICQSWINNGELESKLIKHFIDDIFSISQETIFHLIEKHQLDNLPTQKNNLQLTPKRKLKI